MEVGEWRIVEVVHLGAIEERLGLTSEKINGKGCNTHPIFKNVWF